MKLLTNNLSYGGNELVPRNALDKPQYITSQSTYLVLGRNAIHSVKSRISHSQIDVVTNLDGVTVSGDQVPNDFVAHYETFLGQQGDTNHFSTVELFPNKLDSNKAAVMVCPLSTQEAWDIMSSDVTKAVQEFFINGKLLKELNHTIIALIPKVSSPSRINDYRPISCCNVLFKCISKIIANHIKERGYAQLSSGIYSVGVPQCAFKVDIQKAYDTVDWGFLSINGVLHGYFNGKRGLRQDDPLFPYLFTLIMEVLTLMLSRRVRDSELFTYHRYCLELEIVNLFSHLKKVGFRSSTWGPVDFF
ncbi:hypothetical protein Tco_0013628 [Tanacetum coccineum]